MLCQTRFSPCKGYEFLNSRLFAIFFQNFLEHVQSTLLFFTNHPQFSMPTAMGLQHWCSVTDFNIPKHKKIKILQTLYTVIIISQVTASKVPSDLFGGYWAPCWIRTDWNNLSQQHTPCEGAPDNTRCWRYFHSSKRKLSHLVARWHVSLVLSLENHGAVPALQSWTWAQG